MAHAETGTSGKLRIVQWATGQIGRHALRKVIEHPGFELVGVHVFSENRDAGELCGLPDTGVKATRRIEDVIALKPDCVLYMQEGVDYDDVCRLLAAGINIVTTRGEFHYAEGLPPEIRARVEAACSAGNSSIHATGASPGFITEAVPMVLASIQRRIDHIEIEEFVNMVDGCSPFMLFETMGYGKPPATFDERRLGMVLNGFRQSLELLGAALGKPIETIEASAETACATRPIAVPGEGGGTIEPGTLAAERVTLVAMHQGKPFVTLRANWYCGKDIDADWPLRDVGWRVRIDGDCPLDVTIHFPIPKDRMFETLPGSIAHRPVNAVPYVCAAPPGIVSTMDLPQIVPNVGEWRGRQSGSRAMAASSAPEH
jgi:4-hydroxy-tetrahydrodipicolinate reductase